MMYIISKSINNVITHVPYIYVSTSSCSVSLLDEVRSSSIGKMPYVTATWAGINGHQQEQFAINNAR